MVHLQKIKVLRDLPVYPAGTIIYHEWEELPSQYGQDKTYHTDGKWYQEEGIGDHKLMLTVWMADMARWCTSSQRGDMDGWFEIVDNTTKKD